VPADPGPGRHLDRRARLAGRLVAAPARLRRAALAAEGSPAGAAEWTAQQIVLHLVAVEEDVFQQRLLDLRDKGSPEWPWVEPGPAEARDGETLAESIVRFAGARLATLEWVAALDETGWASSGRHATLGVLDVQGILGLAADHDAEHLADLVRLSRSASR
jgi:hypothetical protein